MITIEIFCFLGRQRVHNIRKALDIIHYNKNAPNKAVVSIDAEEAFNRLEWIYLFQV